MLCGTEPKHQSVRVLAGDGTVVRDALPHGDAVLRDEGIVAGCTLEVTDNDASGTVAALQDTTQVEKVVISEESYEKRGDNFRKFKAQLAAPAAAAASSKFAVGQRVRVVGSSPELLGTVRFVGATQFAEGMWIGVELDTPDGKNNGSVAGVDYFSCPDKHGSFRKPAQLEPLADADADAAPSDEL